MIKDKLKDRKLSVVAEKTGLHENTLRGLINNENPDPKLSTIKSLTDYFSGKLN